MLSCHREKTAESLLIVASWQMQQSAKAACGPHQQQHVSVTEIVLVTLGGAMISTTVRRKKMYVYDTFLRFTPTLPPPTFDQHLPSLFFSITEKKVDPPKSCHLILKCCPLHEVVYNFCNAVAWGQH